ncbi:MAG: response regulator transcription factor [Akkermansiaceae bacterium]|nr:response regulator transcription factor [Akkermansiaceae bacterium]
MASTDTPLQPAARPLRIAIIEDDALIRRMLGKLVAKHPELALTGTWGTGEAALAALASERPDVVLVDLELPGISGEDCLRALSGMMPATALIVLSGHDEPERVFAALRAGANGYLLKGTPPAELVAGIRAPHMGGSPLSPAVANLVIRAFQKFPAPSRPAIPLPSLTPRERQILELLAKGKVAKEAAAELHLSYETVRDYLKTIYQKLHVRSRTEAVLRFLEGREA